MAKITTLFDYFNGTTIDSNKWFVSIAAPADPNTTMTVSDGLLRVKRGTGNGYVGTMNVFDWKNVDFVLGEITGTFNLQMAGNSDMLWRDATYLNMGFEATYGKVVYNANTMKFFRVVTTTNNMKIYYSSAISGPWTLLGSADLTMNFDYPFNITNSTQNSTVTLSAFNPTVSVPELLSPIDNAELNSLTPALNFTSSDVQAKTATYQLQIARNSEFTTTHVDALSAGGAGFTGGANPYSNGTVVTYTVQTPLLAGGVTYYWRVRVRNPLGTNEWSSWTTPSAMVSEPFPPTVASGSATTVAATSAVLTGEVANSGGGIITERGFVYGTITTPTLSNSKKIAPGTVGAYSTSITGLTENTTYNWRAYATNRKATTYGSVFSLTTLPASPTISTINEITDSSAKIQVSIPVAGSASITERGVVYSIIANPTLASSKVVSSSNTNEFSSYITGLAGITTYYVRAYVTNATGTTYSNQSQFATTETPAVPLLSTGDATDITITQAVINESEVIRDGTQTVTERGIVISSTSNPPTTSDRKVVATSAGLGKFNVSINNLDPETVHYYRSYAINSLGTGYGPLKSLKTQSLFVAGEGDGYWSWLPDGSSVTIGRNQATPAQASANLLLSALNLENNATYTLYYKSKETDNGETRMVLQWFEGLTKKQQVISPSVPYTFTYDTTKRSWAIRLFVTGANPEADPISAVFDDLYLAKESTFSGFVPFVGRGLTEIRLDNNLLLDKRREDVIQSIFDIVYGTGWRQFTAKTTGLGILEVGDLFKVQDDEGARDVIAWNTSLTVDGGIKETLSAERPEATETDYSKAGSITKSLKRTQISVDKNEQVIESVVSEIYSDQGVINQRFSEVIQDLEGVRTTVQSSGGVNLVKNSVMYAFDDNGTPDYWAASGNGTLIIQASPESLAGGGISGNTFSLNDKAVSQTVTVRKDVDYIAEPEKLYYSFSARVKKNVVGTASIVLSNRNETHVLELPDQREYYWEAVTLEGLLPLDDHYDLTIISDAEANLQVTDVMISPGKDTRQWTQSNGEAMNTNVAITDDGMTIRSNVFRNDYTKIDALGFEVHKHEAGGEKIFGFNGDETTVRKLKAENQISLATMRMVPISYGNYQGMAFTRTENN